VRQVRLECQPVLPQVSAFLVGQRPQQTGMRESLVLQFREPGCRVPEWLEDLQVQLLFRHQ
jgi:hypothetical protein